WTGRVLSWRVSITMEAAFCIEALEEALARHGTPELLGQLRQRAVTLDCCLGAAALPPPQASQSAEQGAGGSMAGVQGARHCLLPGRLAGARAAVARRYGVDLWRGPAIGAGMPAGRL